MMIASIITLLFSFLFQTISSNYAGYIYHDLSLFTTIYILIALLVIKPYFENEKKYLAVLIITGFLMGITYTNAVFLNICLFIVVYYFSKLFHFYFPYNYFTINISTLIGIFIYHIASFFFLFAVGYDQYNFGNLLEILLHSIPMTLIYTTVLYFILDKLFHQLNLREIK